MKYCRNKVRTLRLLHLDYKKHKDQKKLNNLSLCDFIQKFVFCI